jgi:hypothetical protein
MNPGQIGVCGRACMRWTPRRVRLSARRGMAFAPPPVARRAPMRPGISLSPIAGCSFGS